jgi:hypothetical protein
MNHRNHHRAYTHTFVGGKVNDVFSEAAHGENLWPRFVNLGVNFVMVLTNPSYGSAAIRSLSEIGWF